MALVCHRTIPAFESDIRGKNEYGKDLSDIENLSKRVDKSQSLYNAFYVIATISAMVILATSFIPGGYAGLISLASKVMVETTAAFVCLTAVKTILGVFLASGFLACVFSFSYTAKLDSLSKKISEISIKSSSKMSDIVSRMSTINREIKIGATQQQFAGWQRETVMILAENEKAQYFVLLVNDAIRRCVKHDLSLFAKRNIKTALDNQGKNISANSTFINEHKSSVGRIIEAMLKK